MDEVPPALGGLQRLAGGSGSVLQTSRARSGSTGLDASHTEACAGCTVVLTTTSSSPTSASRSTSTLEGKLNIRGAFGLSEDHRNDFGKLSVQFRGKGGTHPTRSCARSWSVYSSAPLYSTSSPTELPRRSSSQQCRQHDPSANMAAGTQTCLLARAPGAKLGACLHSSNSTVWEYRRRHISF